MQEIFDKLLKEYGPQGWWPLSKGNLETKHHNGKPGSDNDRFEIIVGAILTQNTSWTNVEKAIFNLNKNKLLDPEKMAAAKESEIAELVRPAGYYNQKTKRLKLIAKYFLDNTELLNKNINELRIELLSLKGIGPETADSIILYAAEKSSFVIDAYTKRIFSRLLNKDLGSYDNWKEFFESKLNNDVKLFQEYHALIVEHAKKHCKTKPECKNCPLLVNCSHNKRHSGKL